VNGIDTKYLFTGMHLDIVVLLDSSIGYLELGLAVWPFMVDATHVVNWMQLCVGIIRRQSLLVVSLTTDY